MNVIFYLNIALIFMVYYLLGLYGIFCSKCSEVAQKLEYANTSPASCPFLLLFLVVENQPERKEKRGALEGPV